MMERGGGQSPGRTPLLSRTPKWKRERGGRGHTGGRPSSGAATGFLQTTEHFPTARPSRLAAAGTAALRQRRNSIPEFGLILTTDFGVAFAGLILNFIDHESHRISPPSPGHRAFRDSDFQPFCRRHQFRAARTAVAGFRLEISSRQRVGHRPKPAPRPAPAAARPASRSATRAGAR